MSIQSVIARHADQLMQLPNVVGVAIGEQDGQEVIKVYVTHRVPADTINESERIPPTLENYDIDVEELGVPTIHRRE